jgi:uncharacterized membrane protein YozB (DUF420 family)
MRDVSILPAVNATLNAAAAALLLLGFLLVKKRRIQAHRATMLAAFSSSILFLISYLIYHTQVGSVRFPATGSVRQLYLTILVSHTVLAAAVPFLAVITLAQALRERFDRHARIARWTLPIWLYVSLTGVLIYWMLYRMDW